MKRAPDAERARALDEYQQAVNACWAAGFGRLAARHAPRPGDSPALIRRKAAALRADLQRMATLSGPGLVP